MYIDYSLWDEFAYSLNTLQLDINNPRIKYRGEHLTQKQIMDFLIQNEKVYELAKKISEEGYFVGENPIICIENNKKVVVEGNRRTAALKLLQDPKKYLSNARANTLQKNILANNLDVDAKLKCFIAPNRLLANPIIYSRHKGEALRKWETGNQYSFVADMYYEDGLSIEDICDVLNETRPKILAQLKACNLFYEAKDLIYKEENTIIDISTFDLTNLERFYNSEAGREFLGIDFDGSNGSLIIKINKEEFDKRLLIIIKKLLDSERFSRDFNKDEDKKRYIDLLKQDPSLDLTIIPSNEEIIPSKFANNRKNLDDEKNKITLRKKSTSKRGQYSHGLIPRDYYLSFNHDKLDSLFEELKMLPPERLYAFAILIRTYLEQVLYFYFTQKSLHQNVNLTINVKRKKDSLAKVKTLIDMVKGKYKINENIDEEEFMRILKFDGDKEFDSLTLKGMLDYIKNVELKEIISDTSKIKSITEYLDSVKSGLDLAVHNLDYTIDFNANKRAWNTLEPLFKALNENLTK